MNRFDQNTQRRDKIVSSVSFELDPGLFDNPIDIIREIENSTYRTNAVIAFKSYFGGTYVCSFYDYESAHTLFPDGHINLKNIRYPVKHVETNVMALSLKNVIAPISYDEIANGLRPYGKVLFVDRELGPKTYHRTPINAVAVIDLTKNIPCSLSSGRLICEIEQM